MPKKTNNTLDDIIDYIVDELDEIENGFKAILDKKLKK